MNYPTGIDGLKWFYLAGLLFLAAGFPGKAAESPHPPGPATSHWAFQKPVRTFIPTAASGGGGSGNAIDRFLEWKASQQDIPIQSHASPEVLLRRLHLDLVGLPPTRDELRDFLRDGSPDAYERRVDRLLASRQYGERWARHWMDIWRYSDWYGRRHVPDVWNSAPQVWRWRQWMVQSLNRDVGYDRMLMEMLAADELVPEDDSARVATGYLVRNWYALNPNQWMRDVVEHTGKAFLGLTFNCAHCHDHKYDPISQEDYFRFRAFFEPIQVRQDRVPHEADPGPFQRYEYSNLRKVVRHGMVSVYDEFPDARTYLYLRGDERAFPDGKPVVDPAMPGFLGGDKLKIARIQLPDVAAYPGLKRFVQEEETARCRQAWMTASNGWMIAESRLKEARAKLINLLAEESLAERARIFAESQSAETGARESRRQLEVAAAEWNSVEARMSADNLRRAGQPGREGAPGVAASGEPDRAARDARRQENDAKLARAQLQLVQAEGRLTGLLTEHAAVGARPGGEKSLDASETSNRLAARKKLDEALESARKGVAEAREFIRTNTADYTPLTPVYPRESSGRRLGLARWIANRENPLTARVAVNHIWARHFHAPLVSTVHDFGRNGSPPFHPELLDWLAVELMEHGWSMKHLHRLIVTSDAYKRSSSPTSADSALAAKLANAVARDPENRCFWRMNNGQMEAELVRDGLLHAAGELSLEAVDYPLPTGDAENSRVRSIYFECFPEPGGHSPFAMAFDPPEPMECYRRTTSVVPQQALAMINAKLSREQSRALTKRLLARHREPATGSHDGAASFIEAAFETILSRRPRAAEQAECRKFLADFSGIPPGGELSGMPAEEAAASLVHTLFNHHEFVNIR